MAALTASRQQTESASGSGQDMKGANQDVASDTPVPAASAANGGWSPYEVWRTRVLTVRVPVLSEASLPPGTEA